MVGTALGVALLALLPAMVSADLAVMRNGQALKIESWHVTGEQVHLHLPGGGEVITTFGALAAVVPDEIGEARVIADVSMDLERLVFEAARREGLEPGLVAAVVQVESAFVPEAVSPKGAMGLMQLMPATAVELGVTDPLEPAQNVAAGVRHLRGLLARYDGDVRRALAAYNAGAARVDQYDGIPPYRETRAYVERVLEIYDASR